MRPVILGMTRAFARIAPVIHEMEAFISKMRPVVLGMTRRSAMTKAPESNERSTTYKKSTLHESIFAPALRKARSSRP